MIHRFGRLRSDCFRKLRPNTRITTFLPLVSNVAHYGSALPPFPHPNPQWFESIVTVIVVVESIVVVIVVIESVVMAHFFDIGKMLVVVDKFVRVPLGTHYIAYQKEETVARKKLSFVKMVSKGLKKTSVAG
ncbi:hypothetical protein Tco_1439092 [Tanacetum coccineum]